MRHILVFLLLQVALLTPLVVSGQRAPQRSALKPTATQLQDTVPSGQDSLRLSAPKGDIETTIKYSARDSIMFEVDRKVVNLYGDAKINYGELTLEAAYIQIDYESNSLIATPLPDSTGKETGVPVFKDSGGTYSAKRIAYNYKTKKGRISEVVTQQGEGYIHAEVVKKNENDEFFGYHAQYTTCNLEHPHFFIGANKMKGIPNDKVMTGPFNLVVADIPTPLGFLFGLFPMPKKTRASGVIVPSFGESRAQGFYLSNGGYYFAWNDYIGTRLTGDVYSLGGYNVMVDNTYRKRYSYSGRLGVSYRYFKNDEADIERSRSTNNIINALPPTQRTIWINWSHSPEQKPGRGRFSASVNAGSTGHQRLNYNSTSQYLSPTFNSNITYQKTIQNTPFSYTAKLSQGQTSGGIYNFVLPDLNFSMTPISFFEVLTNDQPTGKWYEQFTIGYNVTAQSRLTNVRAATSNTFGVPITEGFATTDTISLSDFDRLWKNGRRSADHNFQLNLGSYKIMRYFNFSPSVSYRESWTDQKYNFRFNPDSQSVDVDTTNFGRIYEYSANASLSTTIYGTAYIGGKRVEAIRHLIRPNIGYSFRPDFGKESFGFYQNVQTTAFPTNRDVFTLLPRVANAPGAGLQNRLTFSVSNNIEMKVKSQADSAAAADQFEKVSILDNLGVSTSYNFAADSLKLAPISLVANTRLFKIFNVTFNSTFEPYKRDSLGAQVDEYVFDFSKLKLATLTNANFTLSASLNPEARQSSTAPPSNLPILNPDRDPLLPDYVDFKIPWTLSFDYTIGYFRTFGRTAGKNITQTLGVNGSVNLTDKWKITYFAGYDFTNKNISNANLQIYRDLHCWEMSIGWIPYGFAQGYNITINAKSALLQDLRLTRNRSARNRY